MHILDILITIALVYFIATRFLGYKLPIDKALKQKKKKSSKTHGAPKTTAPQPAIAQIVDLPRTNIKKPEKDDGTIPGLAEVKQAMPDFRQKTFLSGAEKAYQYFYTKKNDAIKDLNQAEALEPLLTPHLLDILITELEDGTAKKTTVKAIEKAEIIEAKRSGRTAILQVQFTALQAEGQSKTKAKEKKVKTIWTFAKPIDADDPNWDVTDIVSVN